MLSSLPQATVDLTVPIRAQPETMEDFIGIYDRALAPEICKQIIDYFESSSKRRAGVTGQGIDLKKKHSEDIPISLEPEWSQINKLIIQVTLSYFVGYVRRYSHLLTGVLSPAVRDPGSGELVTLTAEHIAGASDKAIANIIARLYYFGVINAQKYRKGEGGYHHYHSEIYPSPNDRHESLHRVLLFMYYLNEVTSGGETEFFYLKRLVRPEAGRLVIAPAGFTHTHKGHVPLSGDKYILTSWILFQPAEYIYRENSGSVT